MRSMMMRDSQFRTVRGAFNGNTYLFDPDGGDGGSAPSGFTADFTPCKETGRITAAGHSFKGEELRIVEHHRFEGVSDPDDSSVLYALETVDGVKGLLIDAYGTYADPRTGAVLKNTSDDHPE